MIAHSEAFDLVTSTGTGWQATGFPCNPAVPSMFPWLSQVAARYESYRFHRIQFEFKTRSATTSTGSVILAFDFDASDSAPTDQLAALAYRDSCGDVPWRPGQLQLNLASGDRLPSRFTRVGAVAGTDIKTYDVGNLFVCLDGVPAGVVGLLEVRYEVELFVPQIQNGIGGSIASGGAGSVGSNNMFGAAPTIRTGSNLPFTLDANGWGFTLNQDFEGLIQEWITGTGLGGFVNVVVAGSAQAACTALGTLFNQAGTIATDSFKIKGLAGDHFGFNQTVATTFLTSVWEIAAAAFNTLFL